MGKIINLKIEIAIEEKDKEEDKEEYTNESNLTFSDYEEANDMSNKIYMTEEDYMIYKWQQEGKGNM